MKHLRKHFDADGVCDCDCTNCTSRDGDGYDVCICAECDQAKCGMHIPSPDERAMMDAHAAQEITP